MAISAELRRRLIGCVREFHAEQGHDFSSGKLFVEIENEACDVGDAVATAMMEDALSQQAAESSAEETACCPRCGREGKRDPAAQPRRVETRRGLVNWQEAKYYCRWCRQAFFPSV